MNTKKNKKQMYLSKMCLIPYWGEGGGVVLVEVKFDDCRRKLRYITANLTQIISLQIFFFLGGGGRGLIGEEWHLKKERVRCFGNI